MNEINNDLLDSEQVNNLKEIFSEGFSDLIANYFKDFLTREQALSTAISAKNIEEATKLAHALKGSSLNVGAVKLADICSRIEMAGKQENLQVIIQEYSQLKEIFNQTYQAYMQLLQV